MRLRDSDTYGDSDMEVTANIQTRMLSAEFDALMARETRKEAAFVLVVLIGIIAVFAGIMYGVPVVWH